MTRSTASRRARNSDSVMIGGRRRPDSRPSRRRCRLASSRVEPLTARTSVTSAALSRGGRTWTTVFGGSSVPPDGGPSPSPPEPVRRRRRRRPAGSACCRRRPPRTPARRRRRPPARPALRRRPRPRPRPCPADPCRGPGRRAAAAWRPSRSGCLVIAVRRPRLSSSSLRRRPRRRERLRDVRRLEDHQRGLERGGRNRLAGFGHRRSATGERRALARCLTGSARTAWPPDRRLRLSASAAEPPVPAGSAPAAGLADLADRRPGRTAPGAAALGRLAVGGSGVVRGRRPGRTASRSPCHRSRPGRQRVLPSSPPSQTDGGPSSCSLARPADRLPRCPRQACGPADAGPSAAPAEAAGPPWPAGSERGAEAAGAAEAAGSPAADGGAAGGAAAGGPAGRVTARRARRNKPCPWPPSCSPVPSGPFADSLFSRSISSIRAISPVRLPGAADLFGSLRATRELFVRAHWSGTRHAGVLRVQARCHYLSLCSVPPLWLGRFRRGACPSWAGRRRSGLMAGQPVIAPDSGALASAAAALPPSGP